MAFNGHKLVEMTQWWLWLWLLRYYDIENWMKPWKPVAAASLCVKDHNKYSFLTASGKTRVDGWSEAWTYFNIKLETLKYVHLFTILLEAINQWKMMLFVQLHNTIYHPLLCHKVCAWVGISWYDQCVAAEPEAYCKIPAHSKFWLPPQCPANPVFPTTTTTSPAQSLSRAARC